VGQMGVNHPSQSVPMNITSSSQGAGSPGVHRLLFSILILESQLQWPSNKPAQQPASTKQERYSANVARNAEYAAGNTGHASSRHPNPPDESRKPSRICYSTDTSHDP
jgi:hypothetical protein